MLWIGGVFSSALWGEAPDSAAWAAPAYLYVAALLTLWGASVRQRVLFIAIGLFGFAVEVLGAATGVPFGEYHYTETLNPSLFDVPIALVAAWIVITAFVFGLLVRLRAPRRWWPLVGPALMVLTDFLLEPVATGPMDAWVWDSTGGYYDVPAVNFLGWFVVSVPIFSLLAAFGAPERSGFVAPVSVIAFFIALSAVNGLWGPLLITAVAFLMLFAYRRFNAKRPGKFFVLRKSEPEKG